PWRRASCGPGTAGEEGRNSSGEKPQRFFPGVRLGQANTSRRICGHWPTSRALFRKQHLRSDQKRSSIATTKATTNARTRGRFSFPTRPRAGFLLPIQEATVTLQLSVAARDGGLDAFETAAGTAAHLKIYTGAQLAN